MVAGWAWSTKLGRFVALKFLPDDVAKDPQTLSRFERKAKAAIELDQNFAMGYAAVGTDYSALDEPGRASEYLTKAFRLREHASEREKLAISAQYYLFVTGELDKAAETYQEAIESYPRDWAAYNNLSIVFANRGNMRKPWRSRGKPCALRRIG